MKLLRHTLRYTQCGLYIAHAVRAALLQGDAARLLRKAKCHRLKN